MTAKDDPDPRFDEMTARLLRREALRRAAHEGNTSSGQGLENVLARISAEMTAEAMILRTGSYGKDIPTYCGGAAKATQPPAVLKDIKGIHASGRGKGHTVFLRGDGS